MNRRFLRNVRVQIGDDQEALVITDLFVKFRVRREATDTPADGHVTLYNLTEANEARVRERGVRARLEAGYGGDYHLLFDGDVRRVERMREGQNRVIKVALGGNATKQRQAIFIQTYEGTVSIREIVRDAVATMDLALGPLDLIPEDAQEIDFAYHGPTRALLDSSGILAPFGLRMYEDNGVMRVSRVGETNDDRPAGVTISERTGMIGTPTITDDGIRVRSLIDARVRLDTLIRVESELLDGGDRWKVVALEHHGDNREGPYETIVEGRPLDATGDGGADTVYVVNIDRITVNL